MCRILLLFLFLFQFSTIFLFAQKNRVDLWNDVPSMKKEKTKLYIFSPPDSINNGASVIICPGGSYFHLKGIKHEGFEVAEWLVKNGITAYVLRYRVKKDGYNHPAMIQDLQKALKWARDNADKNHTAINKTGVMGFSAGGHLSLMAGIFYEENFLEPLGITSNTNLKPDFIASIYPVVSMQDSLAHLRSRNSFFNLNYNKELIDKYSIEKQVFHDMPPVFLTSAKDDTVVDYRNSLALENALTLNDVKHKFVLYEKGGHGYGMNPKRGGEAANFNVLFLKWLYEIAIIK